MDFENKISTVLKDNCGFDSAVFLAAVSGGADSMAMLSALSAKIPSDRLFCLHVDHGLRRAESREDAEFVRDFCEKRKINFRIKTIAPGKIDSLSRRRGTGIEAAARFFRRRALLKEADRLGNNTVILTAHTGDDALELALMRILRGAGPSGLSAMPVRRGRFLRPIIFMSRADVIDYLTEKKIPWREDSTNIDEKFFRNKVRRRLVPFLNKFFPSWQKGLAGMAQTQSIASAFIEDEAKRRICWKKEAGALSTDEKNFFSQPQIIREEAIFKGVNLLLAGKTSVSVKRHVVRRFCSKLVNSADLGLLRVKREKAKILLCSAENIYSETGFSLLINEPGLYNLNIADAFAKAGVHTSVCAHTGLCIEVLPYSPETEDSKMSFGSFYAGLPLLFRNCYSDDFLICKGKKITRKKFGKNLICAVDKEGIAAFIRVEGFNKGIRPRIQIPDKNDMPRPLGARLLVEKKKALAVRDNPQTSGETVCLVKLFLVKRGIDA